MPIPFRKSVFLLLGGFGVVFSVLKISEGVTQPYSLKPGKQLKSTPELMALGKTTYLKQCSACHGVDGKGNGEAAYLLYPKPRDFVSDSYRLVSTWEGIPTDTDLFYTISRGIPGSSMPSWAHLPEDTRWALVHYVKSLATEPINVETTESDVNDQTGVVKVPAEPANDEKSLARGKELFISGCASCHGQNAKGENVQEQFDSKGFPIRPRDLTQGIFKGNPDSKEVYRRIIAGLPGSPMPASAWAYGDDAWHLTHFVMSLSSDEQREKVEMKKFTIVATKVSQLPDHPDAGTWKNAAPVNLHLMPLWWRTDRPEILTVRAVHDGKEISFLLVWADDTHDATAIRPQDFRDAAALELSGEKEPPFFAMGEVGKFVNIWMWKSEREADLQPVYQDIDKVYPNIGIDSYPNLTSPSVEQPTRNALTMQSDPTFITGWGAGNIVSDPTRRSSSENLKAQGFGTLKAFPKPDQTVQTKGVYDVGTYRVVFKRQLKSASQGSVEFKVGETNSVAFAVWNGSAGDRNGKKSVTIWQDLVIEK
ncbi:c-type cytochrome [bacterium]|nr:c-type cytochrome [bacterium]